MLVLVSLIIYVLPSVSMLSSCKSAGLSNSLPLSPNLVESLHIPLLAKMSSSLKTHVADAAGPSQSMSPLTALQGCQISCCSAIAYHVTSKMALPRHMLLMLQATHNVHHLVVNSVDCDPDIQVQRHNFSLLPL